MYYFEDTERTGFRLPIHWETRTCPPAPVSSRSCFLPHRHPELEVFLVTAGCLTLRLEETELRLTPGSVAIANPFALHGGRCGPDGVTFLCCFASLTELLPYVHSRIHACVHELMTGQRRLRSFFPPEDPETAQLLRLLETLRHALDVPTAEGECQAAAAAFSLFAALFSRHLVSGPSDGLRQRDLAFLTEVSRYLAAHYPEEISSATACRALGMEQSAFCHKFRSQFGSSFSRYLCRYRLLRALSRFPDSRLPISRIAAEVGFSDYCYFSRAFKAMVGQAPAVYFHRWCTPAENEPGAPSLH